MILREVYKLSGFVGGLNDLKFEPMSIPVIWSALGNLDLWIGHFRY